jgi:radical SAM protein with 4Fe4S-binding SPASM domain
MNAVTRFKRWLNAERLQLAYNWQRVEPIGRAIVFQIELTNHCPMTCPMCPRTTQMTRPLGYMSYATYARILGEIRESTARVFLHHFGDSLLHPEIGRFIQLASEHHIESHLSANPILLTQPRVEALVDNGLGELVLSIDGASPETSAAVRGAAARNLALAEDRLRALLDYKRRTGKAKPEVILQIVRQRQNVHEIDAWLERWKGTPGVKRLKVKSYITWDGTNDDINRLRIEERRPAAPTVCDKPWTSVTILWDGRVVPCCFDYDGIMTLGNVNDQPLASIWNGSALETLRRRHRDNDVADIKLCAQCRDKEGHPVRKWYYPLNRLIGTVTPLADEWVQRR